MRKCTYCNSSKGIIRNYHGKSLVCSKHWHHLIRYGKILERTIRDKNEILDCGEYMKCTLYNNKQDIVGYFKFDKEDLALVKSLKWGLGSHGYAFAKLNNKNVLFHLLIMNIPKRMNCDHKFGDRLDNRKSQLRIASISQNRFNQRKHFRTSSKFKGVYWNKSYKKWRVKIGFKHKSIYLGVFNSETEAAIAYNKAAIKYHGEFARLNIIN